MQTKTERLEKIKNYLIKLTSQKTKLDKIEFSGELQVGTEVTFLTEQPLETLELEDKVLTFTDNTVSAIEMKADTTEQLDSDETPEAPVAGSAEQEDETLPDTPAQIELEADDEDEEEEVEVVFDIEKKYAEQEERLRLMDEEILRLLAIVEDLTKQAVELNASVEKLSKEPAVAPEKKTVENFNKTEIKSRAQRVLAS